MRDREYRCIEFSDVGTYTGHCAFLTEMIKSVIGMYISLYRNY